MAYVVSPQRQPDLDDNTSNPDTSLLQRTNNERRDMYHDLVCEHRKLSNEHSRLRLELSKKGKTRPT
jgi:hypothetical protein